MEKYVILVNKGLYEGGKVYNREEVERVLGEWSGEEGLVNEDNEIVSIDYLIEMGSMGEKVEIWNDNMVELGDDWVEISICKLEM